MTKLEQLLLTMKPLINTGSYASKNYMAYGIVASFCPADKNPKGCGGVTHSECKKCWNREVAGE